MDVSTAYRFHFGEMAASAVGDFGFEPELTNHLLYVPSSERLGVQAVLARHGHRVRSLSFCSDRSGVSETKQRRVSDTSE